MSYQISWNDGGLLIRYTGETSDTEVADTVQQAQSDERFDSLLYVIHDFLRCGKATYSQSKIEEIAAIDSAAAIDHRTVRSLLIAVVTDRQDVAEMARAYKDLDIHPHVMRILSSLTDARAWINSALQPHLRLVA